MSSKDILITGLALLAMFFGAGNLIFPPMLGVQSGESLFPALLGFVITGVGLPLLGVTAVAKAGGDLELLANRVNPVFSKIITTVAVLCIGPLLAIPRTAATTFEVAVVPFSQINDPAANKTALFLTTVVFFLIVLFFVLKPTKLLTNLGKILTPFLLIFLAIIIVKGVLTPLGSIGESSYSNPFAQGFIEGYNTMDAIASTIFGMIIVKGIRNKGVMDNSVVAGITIKAGMIAAAGLAFIYVGLAYIGATTGTLFSTDNPGQLLSLMSTALLGTAGKLFIGLAMALACLTTAIGLVASCGEYFSRLSNYRLSYNSVAIVTTLVSFALANMGLAKILEISVPLLVIVYPIIMVLIMLALFHDLFKGKKAVYISTVGITVFLVLLDAFYSLGTGFGLNLEFIPKLLSYLPLYEQSLGWVLPAFIVAILATVFASRAKAKSVQ